MSLSLVENKWIGHIASTAARSLQHNTNRNRSCVRQFVSPSSDVKAPTVEGISQWNELRRSSVPAPTEWLETQLRSLRVEPSVVSHIEEVDVESGTESVTESQFSDSTLPYVDINHRYLNEFDEITCLGRGGFGVVHRVRNRIDQTEYAVKRIDLEEGDDLEGALSEARAMANLPHHPNLIRYFASWLESSNGVDSESESEEDEEVELAYSSHSSYTNNGHALYIQMGLCGEGLTLAQHLKTREQGRKGLMAAKEQGILKQVVSAVKHMHSHGFEHLDLCPRNVFQGAQSDLWCVGDFSFTTKFGLVTEDEVGTHLYAAPEVSGASRSALSGKADVFSLGIIISELCMHFSTAMERAVSLDKVRTSGRASHVEAPALAKMVERMIAPVPNSRPSIAEVSSALSDMFVGSISVLGEVAQAREKLAELLKGLDTNPISDGLCEELKQWKQMMNDPRVTKLIL